MIGYLLGKILFKENDGSLIIETNGVGFKVFVPFFVWQNCQLNDKKELFVYTHVRQDEFSLFGFLKQTDKQIFVNLISVSGIGPKLALNVVSYSRGSYKIIKAIRQADVDFFDSIKGLGKKSAQRIIIDLKSKIGSLKDLEFETEQDQDLIEALKGLGFSREEIKKAVRGIKKDSPLEEKIRLALKNNK